MVKITVKFDFDRPSCYLDIDGNTTIEDLKNIIKEKVGTKPPIKHYRLLNYYRKEFDDSKKIQDYDLPNDTTINFGFRRLNSTIAIKLKEDIIEMEFPCLCCYSILDYKKKIEEKRGYPVDSQNLYGDERGTDLLDNNDYDSIPVLLKIDESKVKKGYSVNFFDGLEEHSISVGQKLEKIKEIKKEIENLYKLPKGSFELIFDGKGLSDDKTLTDYNIYRNSKIYLAVEQKYEKLLFSGDCLLIYYKGKSYTAGLEKYTILEIKNYLNNVIFIGEKKIEKMKVVFRGNILDNNLDIRKEGLTTRRLELIVIE